MRILNYKYSCSKGSALPFSGLLCCHWNSSFRDLFFSGAGGSTLFGSCPFLYLFWISFHPQTWALSILQTHTTLISAKLSLIILDSYVNFLFLPCHDSIFFQELGYYSVGSPNQAHFLFSLLVSVPLNFIF